MKRIGVLSDTHGFVPKQVYSFFADCDELWHAGDIGPAVLDELRAFKPLRAVWGNCDSFALHYELEERAFFEVEGQRVLMTHIGGWPGHYPYELRRTLALAKPDIFVCGHSHILLVGSGECVVGSSSGQALPTHRFLHINPGAAGRQGFHRVSTLVRFTLDPTPQNLEVMDFPKN